METKHNQPATGTLLT